MFLIDNLLFKLSVSRRVPVPQLVGLALLAVLAFEPWIVEPLALSVGSTVALILVASLEARLARSRTAAINNVA
ncbi:hypothetical protein [Rubellimicrobium roseum]|uniref:Uncharacterized protein n=1 Tax=Rubellimicrobium roseum TaxID=687525 RepID=A0A5C4N6E8_9RHOB|nr:hypothetical protein [Rubellimicrobium roseum]TNC66290.1 hypothetical protein FHG71_16910 [Rubellimicrobium roseum]